MFLQSRQSKLSYQVEKQKEITKAMKEIVKTELDTNMECLKKFNRVERELVDSIIKKDRLRTSMDLAF